MPLECIETPNVYGIVSSVYYLLFGLLGLLTNNSFLNDIHAYIFLTGVWNIIEFSGWIEDVMHIPLTIGSGLLLYKLLAELIKRWSEESFDETEKVMGIRGEKFYRLPVSLISVIVATYICLTIPYYTIYFTIGIFIICLVLILFSVRKFFPKRTEHYAITRKIVAKLVITVIIGCFGLATSEICPEDKWIWMRLFIGHPIANVCLSYTLFTSAQIVLMLRGKNLSRQMSVRGNSYIYIAYYRGRFLSR